MFNLAPLALTLLALGDPPASPIAPQDVVAALETAMADSIARAQPSIVAISRIKGPNPDETTAVRGMGPARAGALSNPKFLAEYEEFNSDTFQAMPGDFATGVVVGDRGEILTTYHLLKGAAQIRVRAPGRAGRMGGRQTFEAEIIAADPRSDLAVIAPREGQEELELKLKPLALGNAESLRTGSFLIALGNSYNAVRDDGKASASWGILSNTARRVIAPDGDLIASKQYFRYQPTLLQLDSKLNLGMSGGAVINMKGELVGLTTSAASPAGFDIQAGYAIPLDRLGRRIVETLKQGKEVEYGFLGIMLSKQIPNCVGGVERHSPADQASLMMDDVITSVGDTQLDEGEDSLSLALSSVPVGETVKLTFRRHDEVNEQADFVSKYPPLPQVIATNRPVPWRGLRYDYASVLAAGTAGGRDSLVAMSKGGVAVIEVTPGSPADQAGLMKGLVITEVNGRRVSNPREFSRALADLDRKPVTLTTELGADPGKKVLVR